MSVELACHLQSADAIHRTWQCAWPPPFQQKAFYAHALPYCATAAPLPYVCFRLVRRKHHAGKHKKGVASILPLQQRLCLAHCLRHHAGIFEQRDCITPQRPACDAMFRPTDICVPTSSLCKQDEAEAAHAQQLAGKVPEEEEGWQEH